MQDRRHTVRLSRSWKAYRNLLVHRTVGMYTYLENLWKDMYFERSDAGELYEIISSHFVIFMSVLREELRVPTYTQFRTSIFPKIYMVCE
jgi:hypothetical protein